LKHKETTFVVEVQVQVRYRGCTWCLLERLCPCLQVRWLRRVNNKVAMQHTSS